jgi:hypothetical protein
LLQVQPSLIEPVIALTIVLMASLSLFKVKVGLVSEAWVVFGLGLFHGLGFASAMSTQLQGQIFPLASVLGFNLGIEAGQIAVCLILGLFFQLLQRSPQWLEKVRIWTLWAGFMAGAFWLFERI